MFMRILRGIRDNVDGILDWTEILGSFGALISILFFNFFGVNTITVEIAVLLFILGLLAISRRLDRKINQDTRQSTQEALHAIRTLHVEQTASQDVLQALDRRIADLGPNQSALEHSFQ